jgi:hypothetical protein
MVTALAVALSALAALFLVLLLILILKLQHGEKSATRTAGKLIDRLPAQLIHFFARVGRLTMRILTRGPKAAIRDRAETQVGVRLHIIGAALPKDGRERRVEEMMEERNTLRQQAGRVSRFHYLRLFLGACTIRWEQWREPKRQVD